MDSPPDRRYFEGMDRNRAGILYGIAFIASAILMTGWHWLLTGINEDFGTGVFVGALVAFGLLGILSRRVREL